MEAINAEDLDNRCYTQDDLGKGLGPGVVAILIAYNGRVTAFNIAMWAWVPCAIFQAMTAWTLSYDEKNLQKQLARAVGDSKDAAMVESQLEGSALSSDKLVQ